MAGGRIAVHLTGSHRGELLFDATIAAQPALIIGTKDHGSRRHRFQPEPLDPPTRKAYRHPGELRHTAGPVRLRRDYLSAPAGRLPGRLAVAFDHAGGGDQAFTLTEAQHLAVPSDESLP